MLIARALLVLVLIAPPLRAGVLVVDASGGGDFTTLTAAVAAAANGDTIVVRDGEYVEPGPVVIDDKALTITGNPVFSQFGPNVTIRPGLLVRNLAAGKFVYLENLRVIGSPSTSLVEPTVALALHDNASHVRVQNCSLVGGKGASNNYPGGANGVEIGDSYSTALIGCGVSGGDGRGSGNFGATGYGGAGVFLEGGQVHLSYSHVQGGDGGGGSIDGFAQGGGGGPGLVRWDTGTVITAGATMRGGDGGDAHFGGPGGDGLWMEGGTVGFAMLMAGSFATGGNGGSSDDGPNGAHGTDVSDPAGLVVNSAGIAHAFDVTSPLREGEFGTLDLGGQFGESTLLFVSVTPHQLLLTGYQGVLMLSPTALIGPFVFGTGVGQFFFGVPTLPAAVSALNLHVQPAYSGTHGVVLGPGRVLTLLDASF